MGSSYLDGGVEVGGGLIVEMGGLKRGWGLRVWMGGLII